MKRYVIRVYGDEFALYLEGESIPVVIGPSPKKLARAAWIAGAQEVKHVYDGSKLPPEEQ